MKNSTISEVVGKESSKQDSGGLRFVPRERVWSPNSAGSAENPGELSPPPAPVTWQPGNLGRGPRHVEEADNAGGKRVESRGGDRDFASKSVVKLRTCPARPRSYRAPQVRGVQVVSWAPPLRAAAAPRPQAEGARLPLVRPASARRSLPRNLAPSRSPGSSLRPGRERLAPCARRLGEAGPRGGPRLPAVRRPRGARLLAALWPRALAAWRGDGSGTKNPPNPES